MVVDADALAGYEKRVHDKTTSRQKRQGGGRFWGVCFFRANKTVVCHRNFVETITGTANNIINCTEVDIVKGTFVFQDKSVYQMF